MPTSKPTPPDFADTVPEAPLSSGADRGADRVAEGGADRGVTWRASATIDCPRCRRPMRQVALPGHHAPATVDIDHCGPCGLVWFDARESVHLAPRAWIELLRDLHHLRHQQASDLAHVDARACPICRQALKEVRNQTRYGRFPALECGRCGGHLHSQAGMFAERGLVRPLLPAERYALMAEKRTLLCLNCGAPADGKSEDCAWCRSPLLMIDMPRLASSLRKRSASEPLMMPNGGKPLGWSCHGCGAPMDPTRETRCAQCHHAVVAPSLEELDALLDAVDHDWHADAAQQEQERRERLATYVTPRDAAGGKHGLFWKGPLERRYDRENERREGGRRTDDVTWDSDDLPPTLIEIALRLAAKLLR